MTKEEKAAYDKIYKEKNKEKIKSWNKQFYQRNKERLLDKQREYNKKHLREINTYKRTYYRYKRYGIDKSTFDHMFELQQGKCFICETSFDLDNKNTSPHIDHSHITGKVRHLLCMKCNLGIGNFQERPDLLVKASEYLQKFF